MARWALMRASGRWWVLWRSYETRATKQRIAEARLGEPGEKGNNPQVSRKEARRRVSAAAGLPGCGQAAPTHRRARPGQRGAVYVTQLVTQARI